MLLALQQEIYSFVASFILKYIGNISKKYRKNTLYSTITTHTKRFFNVLEYAKRAAGHSRQAVRIFIIHNYALLITVSLALEMFTLNCFSIMVSSGLSGAARLNCIIFTRRSGALISVSPHSIASRTAL